MTGFVIFITLALLVRWLWKTDETGERGCLGLVIAGCLVFWALFMIAGWF